MVSPWRLRGVHSVPTPSPPSERPDALTNTPSKKKSGSGSPPLDKETGRLWSTRGLAWPSSCAATPVAHEACDFCHRTDDQTDQLPPPLPGEARTTLVCALACPPPAPPSARDLHHRSVLTLDRCAPSWATRASDRRCTYLLARREVVGNILVKSLTLAVEKMLVCSTQRDEELPCWPVK